MIDISDEFENDLRYVHFGTDNNKRSHIFCSNCNKPANRCTRMFSKCRKRKKFNGFPDNFLKLTKYNIFNFIPKNLFYQFHRLSNIYFLIIIILSTTPISPRAAATSVVPFAFVLISSMIKDGLENYKLYKQEKTINNQKIFCYSKERKNWIEKNWKDIQVGDIVMVTESKNSIPADLLLLNSSIKNGMCMIETSNLDGETNLKIKKAARNLCKLHKSNDEAGLEFLSELNGFLEYDPPNYKIQNSGFSGKMFILKDSEYKRVYVNMSQLLLRGCTLQNTKWIIGMAVFTGKETKLALNSQEYHFKRSQLEYKLDKILLFVLAVDLLLCLFGTFMNCVFLNFHVNKMWYLLPSKETDIKFNSTCLLSFGTYFVLLEVFIPISLYVTLEFSRFFQSYFMNHDINLSELNQEERKPIVQNSNLNEELGQITHILTDKTGTLTENCMKMISLNVDNMNFNIQKKEKIFYEKKTRKEFKNFYNDPKIRELVALLTLCNTVLPISLIDRVSSSTFNKNENIEEKNIQYNADSVDEKAIVEMCKSNGFVLKDRQISNEEIEDEIFAIQKVTTEFLGETYEFKILEFLEFDSERKTMSVIVKDPRDGKIKLYCKGADEAINKKLSLEAVKDWDEVELALNKYTDKGLRTLCCAYREIDVEEFKKWQANHKLVLREEFEQEIMRSFDKIERGLSVLGVTAVKDKLQKNVAQTILLFKRMNIKVWMVTGDKMRTALNIGKTCKLIGSYSVGQSYSQFDDSETILILEWDKNKTSEEMNFTLKAKIEQWLERIKEQPIRYSLLFDGNVLSLIFSSQEKYFKMIFKEICWKSNSVICCRVTPQQKSKIVKMVKSGVKNSVVMAVGDGANDVSMIKESNVGVGISGKEGMQASLAADYSLEKFRFLGRLIYAHGAWNFHRLARLILYFFYKNFVVAVSFFIYSITAGWSGILYANNITYSLFNALFTTYSALLSSTIDKYYSSDSARKYPYLYKTTQQNEIFNLRIFLMSALNAIFHSIIIFFTIKFALESTMSAFGNGRNFDLYMSFTASFTIVMVVVTIKMMFETHVWTLINILIYIISFLLFFSWEILYSIATTAIPYYFAAIHLYSIPNFWFSLFLCVCICNGSELLYRFTKRYSYRFVENYQIIQEIEQKKPNDDLTADTIQFNSIRLLNASENGTHTIETSFTDFSRSNMNESSVLLLSNVLK